MKCNSYIQTIYKIILEIKHESRKTGIFPSKSQLNLEFS